MEKKKQAKKKGHVLRVSDQAWEFFQENETGSVKETVDSLLEELVSLREHYDGFNRAKSLYVLLESNVICTSLEEARGHAILRAVKSKKKKEEKPIKVKIVD